MESEDFASFDLESVEDLDSEVPASFDFEPMRSAKRGCRCEENLR